MLLLSAARPRTVGVSLDLAAFILFAVAKVLCTSTIYQMKRIAEDISVCKFGIEWMKNHRVIKFFLVRSQHEQTIGYAQLSICMHCMHDAITEL